MPLSKLQLMLMVVLWSGLLTACTFHYQREQVDAELFIPLIPGFDPSYYQSGFQLEKNIPAFRISRALENQYIATLIEDIKPQHYCSGIKPVITESDDSLPVDFSVRITKILQPFDWQYLENNEGIFKDVKGGVLFGQGARLTDASLLSLRYVLSPLDEKFYEWSSPSESGSNVKVNIPYRYFEFKEIAISHNTLSMFDAPMCVYKAKSGEELLCEDKVCSDLATSTECNPDCQVCDDIELSIFTEGDVRCKICQDERCPDVMTDTQCKAECRVCDGSIVGQKPQRLQIQGTRKMNISFTDPDVLSPIRYRHPVKQGGGWIDVIDLSFFPEGGSYMNIVRALTLAQAGDCDGAYTIYKVKIEPTSLETDDKNAKKVLTLIAHLHGRSGGNISAVLKDLRLIPGVNEELVKKYEILNEENLKLK